MIFIYSNYFKTLLTQFCMLLLPSYAHNITLIYQFASNSKKKMKATGRLNVLISAKNNTTRFILALECSRYENEKRLIWHKEIY